MNRNAQPQSFNLPQTNGITWLGIALLLVTAAIHFIDAPGSFDDAKYKGVLFILNGIGALIAAIGVWRNERGWGLEVKSFQPAKRAG